MVKDSCVGVAQDSYVAKDNCALEVKGKKKILFYFVFILLVRLFLIFF